SFLTPSSGAAHSRYENRQGDPMHTNFNPLSRGAAWLTAVSAVLSLAGSAAADAPRTATFQVRHELSVSVPEGANSVKVWFAYPQDDPAQTVSDVKIDCPFAHEVTTDPSGNKILFVE